MSPRRLALRGILLVASLGLLGMGAAGLAVSHREPAPDSLLASEASSCHRLTRHVVIWESPVRSPFEHSGRVDAYLNDDVDHAWMAVTADQHALADWSFALWTPEAELVQRSAVEDASGPEYENTRELGPLEAGLYRFTWKQAGLVEDLTLDVLVTGCVTEARA